MDQSFLSLIKQLLQHQSEIRQNNNQFIENSSLSLDDFNKGNISPMYFVEDQKEFMEKYRVDTNVNNFHIDTITKKLNKIISVSNQELAIVSEYIDPNIKQDTEFIKDVAPKYEGGYCSYEGNCKHCAKKCPYGKDPTKYCLYDCVTCKTFRECDKKNEIEEAKEIYHTKIQPHSIVKKVNHMKDNTQKNILNQTINNTYIKCDSLEINIQQPYFVTPDKIYYVTIEVNRSTVEEKIKTLKHVFTYSLCGVKGKYIFPHEEKHSLALTFPVSAALYTIKNLDTNPVLHGLIKYTKNKNSSMSVSKIQGIDKSSDISKKPLIKATLLPIWEDKKNHYCTEFLNDTIKTITKTSYYGSEIDDFIN